MATHIITHGELSIEDIVALVLSEDQVALSPTVRQQVLQCRAYLDQKLANSDQPIYGVNTGFGALCDVNISSAHIHTLQLNLVRSHACGAGRPIDPKITRLVILLKIINLSKGYSGASLELLDLLITLYNQAITPVLYEFGSLGASGDLAPLAHIALACIGEGEVNYHGKVYDTDQLFSQLDIEPVILQAKEGLALLNGTQFSTALAIYACYHGMQLIRASNVTAALSTLSLKGNYSAFDSRVHEIRKQAGQISCAAQIRGILMDNEYLTDQYVAIQDPYSIRCVPQVHGASLDSFRHAKNILERELNAVTDNPNIFWKDDDVISAGNFHAQPIALIIDYMNMALSELGNIAERRIFQLLSGKKGLPSFLVQEPGINSGMMIAQYTAASLVNQNKTLCMPNSVDSIVSSNGQEDHVSMSANAGTKAYQIVDQVYTIIGIEMMCAAQAMSFRSDIAWSDQVSTIYNAYRLVVPRLDQDRRLDRDIAESTTFVRTNLPTLLAAE